MSGSTLTALIVAAACVTLPARKVQADELPQHACGVRMSLGSFEQMMQREVERMLGSIHIGVSFDVTDVTIRPALGGLRYEEVECLTDPNDPGATALVTVPRRVPPEERDNDPNTGNDDYLLATISLKIGGIMHPDLKVAVAVPQDTPPGVDPTNGRTCMCRNWDHDIRDPIAALPPCPEIPDPTDPPGAPSYRAWCNGDHALDCSDLSKLTRQVVLSYYQTNCLAVAGYMFDFYNYPRPPSETADGAGVSQYYDDSSSRSSIYHPFCERIWADTCTHLSTEEFVEFQQFLPHFGASQAATHACVACLTYAWSAIDVQICGRSWPNLLAVELWSDYTSYTLKEELYKAGFIRGRLESDVNYDVSCCLQRALGQLTNTVDGEAVDQIHAMLNQAVPGMGTNTLQSLAKGSGVRFSGNKDSIYIMIPPVWIVPGVDDALRPDGQPECRNPGVYADLYGDALQLSTNSVVDLPKAVDHYLRHHPSTRADYASGMLRVECNHSPIADRPLIPWCPECSFSECTSGGGLDFDRDGFCSCVEQFRADSDGDGFCDDEDYCPTTFTGANCDHDGDGLGDAPKRMVDRCMQIPAAGISPPFGYGQVEESARQFYCGGCDNCPRVFNPWGHLPRLNIFNTTMEMIAAIANNTGWQWIGVQYASDMDPEHPEAPMTWDFDREVPLPSNQLDRDMDGIGDACDEDGDLDHVHRAHDCDDRNPQISIDRDGDGICDEVVLENICITQCNENNSNYLYFDVEACKKRCQRLDNCAEAGSLSLCGDVTLCQTVQAARSPDDCPSPECTFVPGPEWPSSSYGNRCIPARDWCSRIFANHEQQNVDSDAIGDKCDWNNVGSPDLTKEGGLLVFGDGHYTPYPGGTFYMVTFRSWGGHAAVENAQLVHHPEPRTNTQVGACHCDTSNPDGSWNTRCYDDNCPILSDRFAGQSFTPWNPINAPECNQMGYTGRPEEAEAFATYGICYNRELGFSRDEETNSMELTWRWAATRQVGVDPVSGLTFVGGIIGPDYSANMAGSGKRTTKARVAWPMYGEEISYSDLTRQETAYTPARGLTLVSIGSLNPFQSFTLPDDLRHFTLAPAFDINPSGPVTRTGYLYSKDPVTETVSLLGLAGGAPNVARALEASFSDGIDTVAEMAGAAGTLKTDPAGGTSTFKTGVFLYQGPASPSLLYIGHEEEGSDTVTFQSTEALYGTTAPGAYDPLLAFVPDRQELVLLGAETPGGPRDRLWRLRLADGSWEGPLAPRALTGLRGYTATYDPLGRAILIAGGYRETLCIPEVVTHPCDGPFSRVEASAVLALDVESLDVQPFGLAVPAPAEVARASHGASLDVGGRALYLVGGARGTAVLGDSWKLDLRLRRWSLVEASGPALLEPFVAFDPARRTLWAGDYTGASLAEGLALWGRPVQGSWLRTSGVTVESATTWPADGTFVQGRTGTYLWPVDGSQALPGQHVLAVLDAAEPSLGVSIRPLFTSEENPSELDALGHQVAGMLCPSGERCLLEVDLVPGSGQMSFIPYSLDVVPATPVLETFSHPGGIIEDLAVRDGKLFVAVGPWGLKVLEAGTLAETGRLGGSGIGGATAIAFCGGRLCVARRGVYGLSVVEPGWRQDPYVLAEHRTDSGADDIAVSGGRIYLAHGNAGVGVYQLPSPGALSHIETFEPAASGGGGGSKGKKGGAKSGKIVSVALLGDRMLATAEETGAVYLYDLTAGRVLAATVQVPGGGKLERVRFRGTQLWVLSSHPDRVTIYDASDVQAPTLLGQPTAGAVEEFRAQYAGARRYSFGSNLVSVYRMEAVTP